MTLTVEAVPNLKSYAIEWAEEGNYFLSKRNILYHSEDLMAPFKQVAAIEAPPWKALAARFRLGQRLLRFMVTNVLPLGNGDLFVTFDKSVGLIRDGQWIDLKLE